MCYQVPPLSGIFMPRMATMFQLSMAVLDRFSLYGAAACGALLCLSHGKDKVCTCVHPQRARPSVSTGDYLKIVFFDKAKKCPAPDLLRRLHQYHPTKALQQQQQTDNQGTKRCTRPCKSKGRRRPLANITRDENRFPWILCRRESKS